MRPLPEDKLDPRIKHVWRISDAIWITAIALVPALAAGALGGNGAGITPLAVVAICWAAALVIWLVVLPSIRYARWRYQLSEDYLDIAKGIIWRKRYIIPFIRVQNTDTRQGPLLRAFKLASVTVSTAAGDHEIPGLQLETADALRDKAAELARLAREDV